MSRYRLSGFIRHRLAPALMACAGLGTMAGCGDPGAPVQAATPQAKAGNSVVLAPEDSDRLWVFAESPEHLGSGGELHIFIDPEHYPAAAASFAKFSLGPGGELPVHRHDKTEEVGYFTDGEGVVTLFPHGEKKEIPVRPGHVVYIAPGEWHALRNTGQAPFSLVFATVPNEKKGLLSFFRRIGAPPGQAAATYDEQTFSRLAREHDLILKGTEKEP